MEELTFEDYCKKKKINPDLFLKAEPTRFQEWKTIFDQVHPDSFTEQKKFLINPIRKQYLLIELSEEKVASSTVAPPATKASIKIPPLKKL